MYSGRCGDNGDERDKILLNAPEQKDGAFKVPKDCGISEKKTKNCGEFGWIPERLWKTASMTDMNGGNNVSILDLTAVALGKKIKDGEITAVEATKAALAQIKTLEPVLNCYVTVDEEGALKRAEESTEAD